MGRRGRGQRLTDRVKRWNAKMNPDVMGDILKRTKELGLEKVSRYQADFQFLMDVARSLVSKYPDYYPKMHDVMSYLERIWYFSQRAKGEALKQLATGAYLAWRYRGFPDDLLREGAKALGVTLPSASEIASVLGLEVPVPQPKLIMYETTVTITNNSGRDLEDYAVPITLSEDWEGWKYVRFDGSDIHFIDDNGDPLYCYPVFVGDAFKWGLDNLGRVGYVYVKVPSLPNGSSITLKMRFGSDNPFPEYQDPSKVFLFFDDFEVWEGWRQYGLGFVEQVTNRRFDGKYGLLKTKADDPNGGLKYIGQTIGRDIILEFFDNRPSGYTGGAVDRVGVVDDNGNGYGWSYDHNRSTVGFDRRSNYYGATLSDVSVRNYLDRWVRGRLAILSNGLIRYELWLGNIRLGGGTATHTQYNEFTQVYVFGGHDYYVDVFLIRKYVEPEPQVTLGSITRVEA